MAAYFYDDSDSNSKKIIYNLDNRKFETELDMNGYPSLLTPPSESPERSHASSPPIDVYGDHDSYSSIKYNNMMEELLISDINKKMNNNKPYLKILEQPQERFRFRYKSEMAGTHGSLTGRFGFGNRKQTYPTVQLCNFNEESMIRCSVYQVCVDENGKCHPHAHKLIRKAGLSETDDPHNIIVTKENNYIAGFHSMGIIHTARKNLLTELLRKVAMNKMEQVSREDGKKRELTGPELLEVQRESDGLIKQINLNVLRLRFEAFKECNGILFPICPPVYSKSISNLKSAQTCDLKIVRMDNCTSPFCGQTEIFMLVEKVTKNNIKIRFYELNEDDDIIWEDYGIFNGLDVHHQYAIVFRTPPYREVNCNRPVKVYVELFRPSDKARSEPKEFTYLPCRPVNGRKRPRTYSKSNRDSFEDIPQTVPAYDFDTAVKSEELEEAILKQNVTSSEFERFFDDMKNTYDLYDPDNFLTQDGASDAKTDFISMDDSKSENLSEEDKNIVARVYKELDSFLKTKPDQERKIKMSLHLFKDYCSSLGNTPFHLSIYSKSRQLLLLLMSLLSNSNTHPSIINATNDYGDTIMHAAVNMELVVVVNFLISQNANIALQNDDGNTPLHLCSRNSFNKRMNQLIQETLLMNEKQDLRTIIDLENNSGDTPLSVAIKSGNLQAMKRLCWKGADVNKIHKKNGFTPLHIAIYEQNYEMVNFLLDYQNINVQAVDFKDCTPYKLALNLSSSIVGKKICRRIEEYMSSNGILSEMVEIKQEFLDEEIKQEPMSPFDEEEELVSPKFDSITPECLNKVSQLLDVSGNWKNLAELLDMEHFLRIDGISNYKSPSKSLLNLALANGEGIQRIRDFLENLDEKEIVQMLDNAD